MSDSILMDISPSSRLSDIEALFCTYGIILTRDGKICQTGPLYGLECVGGIGILGSKREWPTELLPAIDNAIEIRMVRLESPAVNDAAPRWPFWVSKPVSVKFSIGDQWWQYDFSPGKTYRERTTAALADSSTGATTGSQTKGER